MASSDLPMNFFDDGFHFRYLSRQALIQKNLSGVYSDDIFKEQNKVIGEHINYQISARSEHSCVRLSPLDWFGSIQAIQTPNLARYINLFVCPNPVGSDLVLVKGVEP